MEENREIKWEQKKIDTKIGEKLSKELELPKAIGSLLASRGIKTKKEANEFLSPDYVKQIHNPFLMKDMKKAVERINLAIDRGERIMCYGDYDCDGVATSALFKKGFELLSKLLNIEIHVDIYAPNRFSDGYGLNIKKIKEFEEKYDLIISGDTGIRAFESASYMKQSGKADLIVTDHHEPWVKPIEEKETAPTGSVVEVIGEECIALPDCYAIVDPHRLGDEYPCKTLAGVGIVFKLFQALFISRKLKQKPLFYYLDLVATGSIADLAGQICDHGEELDFEVRTMCKFGIEVMNKKPKPWVKAIREAKGIKGDIGGITIGFQIGPVLNAPGRIEKEVNAMKAVHLLLEEDEEVARKKAVELDEINKERQEQTRESQNVINELLDLGEEYHDYSVVYSSDDFHIGIAGLVASDFVKEFYRPSFAMAPVEKDGKVVLKGSARSIKGISVVNVLTKVEENIGKFEFGGHEQAAGYAILPEQFEDFRKAIRKECMKFPAEVFEEKMEYDYLMNFDEIDFTLLEHIETFKPFAQPNNQEPLFMAKNVRISYLKPLKEGKMAKFTLKQNGQILNGIMFRDGERVISEYQERLKEGKEVYVDMLFAPKLNHYNGNTTLQIQVQDIKFH